MSPPLAQLTHADAPPITDGPAAIRYLRDQASAIAGLSKADDELGPGIEKLVRMIWGDEAAEVFGSDGEEAVIEAETIDVDGKDVRAEEPGFFGMSLLKGKRPTHAQALSLTKSDNVRERELGNYIVANPHLTEEGRPLTKSEDAYLRKLAGLK